MDDEYLFITETILPSLLVAAEKIEGVKKITPSVGVFGEPAVLVFFDERSLLISCTILEEGSDIYSYGVEEPGEWLLEFPSLCLPQELPFFAKLPVLYDRIRFGEPFLAEDGRSEAMKRVAEMYERIRIPVLKNAFEELGMDCAVVEDKDGRSSVVAKEYDEFIRFSYGYTIPELSLTVLIVKSSEEEILIPEYGNVSPVSDYEKILGTIG